MLPIFRETGDESGFPRERLATRLRELAAERIYVGGSSWKYEGWLGQIYRRDRYQTRGRFSRKRFEAHCLAEYAEVFPIAGGDFSFYQFPSPEYWHKLFSSAPQTLLYGFKVPEMITVPVWPRHARYGPRAGLDNPTYLDAGLFESDFARLLEPYRDQVACLMFEFGAFPPFVYAEPGPFLEDLDAFLSALPTGFRYGVEIRTQAFLTPEYLSLLRSHKAAHILNAWSRMPELSEQLDLPGVYTADFTVCRSLLARGLPYAEAVDLYQPYDAVQQPNPAGREALRRIIREARSSGRSAFVFVNNRFEGNAPGTILAVVED